MQGQPELRRGPGRPAALPEQPSDAELGVGEDDALSAFMTHPEIAKLIDAAVQNRLAQMGRSAVPEDGGMNAVVAGIAKLTELHATQLPGYSKPLPAKEIESRADGYVQMVALLARYEKEHEWPLYRLVGEPLFAGEVEYRPGSEITTLLYPNEHMMPLNDPARQVHKAMMQWIGGPQIGIGERVEEAERERRGLSVGDRNSPFAAPRPPEAAPVRLMADPPEERVFDPRRPPQAAHQVQPVRVG